MVLRRPYAFLIKHFRLIHLIITALFTYIALESRKIYKYINTVIELTNNKYNASSYIKYNIIIYIVIALILCLVIYLLLKYKNKPRRVYVFTIFGYIIISGFIVTLFGYMQGFSNNVIDPKTIRLYRDILLIVQLFEYLIVIFMLIRGLGFDIKKFNFSKDAQELNATLADSEEVEINTKIDTTNVARSIHKQGREFGYYYKEFKIYIFLVLAIVLIILGYKAYNYYNEKLKIYKENDLIGEKFNITIKDSYYYITENSNYIIINFDITKYGIKEQLNTGNINLIVGNNTYTPDKSNCHKFSKLGICYRQHFIENNINNYILTYKVDNLDIQNSYILYNESYDKVYKVKLIPKLYQEWLFILF